VQPLVAQIQQGQQLSSLLDAGHSQTNVTRTLDADVYFTRPCSSFDKGKAENLHVRNITSIRLTIMIRKKKPVKALSNNTLTGLQYVGPGGIEPPTHGFSVRCSTN
jgi:hypothetical protein